MMLVLWNDCLILLILLSAGSSQAYKRVCYHTNWAQYRPEPYKFFPSNIDPFLCTHIMYSFGKVVGNKIEPYEWNDESTDWSVGKYEETANLKKVNPKLKILLAIGGWTHGSGPFTELVDNAVDIEMFAQNVITYLRRINFDGLDLDWEYPANRGSPPEDKQRFTELCKILRRAFEDEAQQSGQDRLLLTAAVAAGEGTVTTAYEIGLISQELDFINLMSYDLHGSWEKTLGHNSPLYARSDETGEQATLNQNYAVQLWLNGGTPKDKLMMGLGLYGRSFTMGSSSPELGSVAKGAGVAGAGTREQGFLAYSEICKNLENGWTRVWNDEHKVPYAYKGDQWVGYDDVQSIEVKANYVKQIGLGGSMVWAMDLDDFTNNCGNGVNPLMTTLLRLLPDDNTDIPTSHPTQETTTKPTQAPTTKPTQATSTATPSTKSTEASTAAPTAMPTDAPTAAPTTKSTDAPTAAPTTKSTDAPTAAPTTKPTEAPTTKSPGQCGPPDVCPDGEYYGDSCEPAVFYQCWNGVAYKKECQSPLIWDSYLDICNWDYNVNNNEKRVNCGYTCIMFYAIYFKNQTIVWMENFVLTSVIIGYTISAGMVKPIGMNAV